MRNGSVREGRGEGARPHPYFSSNAKSWSRSSASDLPRRGGAQGLADYQGKAKERRLTGVSGRQWKRKTAEGRGEAAERVDDQGKANGRK